MRKRSRATWWGIAAVAVWAVVIFVFSGGGLGNVWSYKLLDRTLRLLAQPLPSQILLRIDFLARKFTHVAEYAVLTVLLYRLLRPATSNSWHAASGRLSVLLSALYAASDEFHQHFVPGRRATVWDWFLDMVGVGIGISAVYLWTRFLSPHRKEQPAAQELAITEQSKAANKESCPDTHRVARVSALPPHA